MYCTGKCTGMGTNHAVYFSWHLNKQFLYNAICKPYLCMLFWFPHNVQSYLPQCAQGFITYELNKQANNSFALKRRLYLWRVEILPWEIARNTGAFLLVPFEEMVWMLVCKPWRRGVILNDISLGIVLAEEKSLSWYFTFF